MKFSAIIVLLTTAIPCHSAFEKESIAPGNLARGGTGVSAFGSIGASNLNPALLGGVDNHSIIAMYSPGDFGLLELDYRAMGLAVPTTFAVFCGTFSSFGYDLYREMSLTVSCGRKILPQVSVGIGLCGYRVNIENYGSASTYGLSIGLHAVISPHLDLGFSFTNANGPTIGQSRERLPQMARTGIEYHPLEDALIAVDLVKDLRFPPEVLVGIEYSLLGVIALRAGSSINPTAFTAGIGIIYEFLSFDYALNQHPVLGPTHNAALTALLGELL